MSLFVFNSCEDDIAGTEDLNYVGFGKIPATVNVEKGSSTSIDIYVSTTKTTNSDRTFNVIVTDVTTLDPATYSMPTSVVIPANSNVGVLTVVFSDVNLGLDPESFQIEFEARTDMYTGKKLTTTIQKSCSLSGLSDLVGTFSVTSATTSLENSITTELDGENLKISDIANTIITGWWGEEITDGGTCIMNVDLTNGALTIPRQYFMTTLYEGAPSTYEIIGSGSWNNCGTSPTLQITYDIYYTGDETGIGNDYASTAFGGLFTKD